MYFLHQVDRQTINVKSYVLLIHRLLASQAERTLEETQAKLARKEMEVARLQEELQALQAHIAELSDAYQTDADHMLSLRTTISSMDKAKDSLQNEVDEKTEKLVEMHELLTSRVSCLTSHSTVENTFCYCINILNSFLEYKDW